MSDFNGEHLTPSDVSKLTAMLLVRDIPSKQKIAIYDNSFGTGELLFSTYNRINKLNDTKTVKIYGQELNVHLERQAKRKAKSLGIETKHLKCSNTLKENIFQNKRFDYININPPYGCSFDSDIIKKDLRFEIGIPKSNDGQLLFLLDAIQKMYNTGRCCAILSGSALGSAWAEDGSDKIRKYIIENDWLECVVKLPKCLFHNTAINTYVWVINKSKNDDRRGMVQFIDAAKCYSHIKSESIKSNILTDDNINEIYNCYNSISSTENCKSVLLKNTDLIVQRLCIVFDNKEHFYDVPLSISAGAFLRKEILSINPNAYIDKSKTVKSYSVNFEGYFNPVDIYFKSMLKDYAELIQGYHFSSTDLVEDYLYPVIMISNIDELGYSVDVGIRYSNDIVERYRIHKNDILIALSGSSMGKTCYVETEPSVPTYANQRVGIIRCFNENNSKALHNSIKNNIRKWIASNVNDEIIPNLNARNVLDFPVNMPL